MKALHTSSLALLVGLGSLLAACGGESYDGAPSSTGVGGGSGSGSGGSGGAGGATTASGSTSATSTTSATTSTSSTGTGGSGQGGGGTGGSAPGAPELLISEVGAVPTTEEFVEIVNPGAEAVSLGDIYLSDNAAYWTITAGSWDPDQTPGTDWVARFPAGSSIGPGDRIVIAGKQDYFTAFGACPDYSWGAPIVCGGDEAVLMDEPVAGGRPSAEPGTGHLSDNREMIVLFRWSGNPADPVEDLDYVTWGEEFDDASRVDKTGEAGYAPDTDRALQRPAIVGLALASISRCSEGEVGETQSGGNGASGHDETSEDLAQSFALTGKTPGAENVCP